MALDLTTFELEDIQIPTVDVLQQIDAGEILGLDDMGDYMDEALIQDLGVF